MFWASGANPKIFSCHQPLKIHFSPEKIRFSPVKIRLLDWITFLVLIITFHHSISNDVFYLFLNFWNTLLCFRSIRNGKERQWITLDWTCEESYKALLLTRLEHLRSSDHQIMKTYRYLMQLRNLLIRFYKFRSNPLTSKTHSPRPLSWGRWRSFEWSCCLLYILWNLFIKSSSLSYQRIPYSRKFNYKNSSVMVGDRVKLPHLQIF